MQTLNAPIYEVNSVSKFYKQQFAIRQQEIETSKVIGELATEIGFNADDFLYYGPYGFGFKMSSESYDLFKEHLTKNDDRNGVYRFKKSSKPYKVISKRMESVQSIEKDPFTPHDVFGINNLRYSQWLDDRLFYEVKDAAMTEQTIEKRKGGEGIEPLLEIAYREYLELVMARMASKEGEKV